MSLDGFLAQCGQGRRFVKGMDPATKGTNPAEISPNGKLEYL